jgi:hypothetical protein
MFDAYLIILLEKHFINRQERREKKEFRKEGCKEI